MRNTPKGLNEELMKMRKLMNFDISENSHDVLSENFVKNANRIDEQEVKSENLVVYPFGGSFENNYVVPNTSSGDYQKALKKMKSDLDKAFSEGKKLSDLKIIVRSSASSRPSTNGYVTSPPPNHNFKVVGKTEGGLLPGGKWVQIPAPGTATLGYKNLTDNVGGNTFLAQNRGLSMKNALVNDLNSMGIKVTSDTIQLLKRQDGKWISTSEDKSEQYVRVEIEGLLTPTPERQSKYIIIYDWYQIGGKDTPYVLIDGANSKYDKKLQHSEWGRGIKKLRQSFVDAVESTKSVSVAGYTKTKGVGNGVGEVEFYAFGTFNGFSGRKGSTFYYTDEKSWLSDVKKINMMNPAEKTIVNGLDGIYAKGVYVKGEGGKGSADFNHGYGTDIALNKLYLIKPTGVKEPVKAMQIKRTESKGGDKITQSSPKSSL